MVGGRAPGDGGVGTKCGTRREGESWMDADHAPSPTQLWRRRRPSRAARGVDGVPRRHQDPLTGMQSAGAVAEGRFGRVVVGTAGQGRMTSPARARKPVSISLKEGPGGHQHRHTSGRTSHRLPPPATPTSEPPWGSRTEVRGDPTPFALRIASPSGLSSHILL